MYRYEFLFSAFHSSIFTIILIFLLSGCTSVSTERTFKVDEALLVKDVHSDSGKTVAGSPVVKFSTNDSEVISYVKLKNVTGSHNLRWEWYNPNGKLYESSDNFPVNISSGKYVEDLSAWHKITVKGEPAQNIPGNWTVYVYYDNNIIAKNNFLIVTPFVAIQPVVAVPIVIEDVDVDTDIPKTKMNNPDAIAVVIGIRRYKNTDIPEVKFAYNDAKIMRDYLINTLGYKEYNIIYKLDATKAEFEQIFGIKGNHEGQLYDLIKPGKSDVFIYYSGHGAPDLNTLKGYFVPSDCDSLKFALGGYSLDVFYENLSQLDTKNITIVLDACFSGGTCSGKNLIASASLFGIKVSNPTVSKGNSICLTSSEGNQISSWYNSKQHGLFTYFFLRGIRGEADKNKDNILTYEELYEYVSDNTEGVPYWARRLHQGRKQNPTIQGVSLNKPLVIY